MHDHRGFAWLSNGCWVIPLGVSVTGLGNCRSLYIGLDGSKEDAAILDNVAKMALLESGELLIRYKEPKEDKVVRAQESASLDYLGDPYAFNDDCKADYDVMLVAEIARFYKQETFSSDNARLGGLSKHSNGAVMLQKGGLIFYIQTLPG